MAERCDVLILGAGASGLMCALECASRGRSVLVLDHAEVPGRKIRLSGGGRCNFTNMGVSPGDYACANPHFVKSALSRYTPWDFLEFLREAGLSGSEEPGGKMFCDQGAQALAEALVRAAQSGGARIATSVRILDAAREGGEFVVHTGQGGLRAASLVIAAGGLAWPQAGATDFSYRTAKRFGLAATKLRPGLVPLDASPSQKAWCASLAGVSLPVAIRSSHEIRGDMLFTHTGISGPAVLETSLFWEPGQPLSIDLLPGVDVAAGLEENRRMEMHNALARLAPRRLAHALCERFAWRGTPASLSSRVVADMERALHEFSFESPSLGGYNRAEVTLGGVDTDLVSSKTMESRDVPGLYILGEALDVTGRLGGFNLHWAWASGFAAGQWA